MTIKQIVKWNCYFKNDIFILMLSVRTEEDINVILGRESINYHVIILL